MKVQFVVRGTLEEVYSGTLFSDAQVVFTSPTTPVSFIDIQHFDDGDDILIMCLESTPQTISRSPNGKIWIDACRPEHQLLFKGK